MIKERIEIEGEALDLMEGADRLAVSLSSNLGHGLKDYTSCYTYGYDVPNSPHNRRILGELLLPGASNRRVRQNLPCVYFRDGVSLLEGSLYVVAAERDTISLSMTFGSQALRRLIEEDRAIYQLDWPEGEKLYVSENGAAVGLPFWAYGQPRPGTFWAFMNEYYIGQLADKFPKVPAAVAVSGILDRIQSETGVTFEGLDHEGDILQFAPEYRKSGEWGLKARSVVDAGIFGVSAFFISGFSFTGIGALDIRERYEGSAGDYATPLLRADSRVEGISYDLYNAGNNVESLYVAPYLGSVSDSYYGITDANGQPRSEFMLCAVGAHQRVVGIKSMLDVSLSEDYQPFIIFAKGGGVWSYLTDIDINLKANFNYNSVTSGSLSIGSCLPDISLADFVSEYAALRYGKYPVNSLRGRGVVHFASLEDVAAAEPYDWSRKLLSEGMRHSYRIDELARNNFLNFANDDSEAVFEEGYYNQDYRTEDETLDDSEDFSEVSFSYSYRAAGTARMLTMAYQKEKNPAPRIVAVGTGTSQRSPHNPEDPTLYTAYNSPELYWLKSDNALRRVMAAPNVVECSVQLTTLDLYELDLARPVYFKQFGKLFYIDSADIDGDNIAELKLVELK